MLKEKELKFNVTKSKMFKLCNTVCPELISLFIFECNSYSFRLFPCAGKIFLRCKRTYDNSEVFNNVVNFDLLKELSFFN